MDRRYHRVQWGPKGDRSLTSDANWQLPHGWNARATKTGVRESVFSASLSDLMDDHPSIQPEWRQRHWDLIDDTPNLDWLLLTKRPENWGKLGIFDGIPRANVRLGVTIENQDALDERASYLRAAHWKGWETFVSYGPAIGPVNWRPVFESGIVGWLVAEGESGNGARPPHPDWFRAARDACRDFGVPFLLKQWGEWSPDLPTDWLDTRQRDVCVLPCGDVLERPHLFDRLGEEGEFMFRVGKHAAGRALDGVIHNEFPA